MDDNGLEVGSTEAVIDFNSRLLKPSTSYKDRSLSQTSQPFSAALSLLDVAAPVSDWYNEDIHTVVKQEEEVGDMNLGSLSISNVVASELLQHEASNEDQMILPLRIKAQAQDDPWTPWVSPDLRVLRRKKAFKRVDSLQPDVVVKSEVEPQTSLGIDPEAGGAIGSITGLHIGPITQVGAQSYSSPELDQGSSATAIIDTGVATLDLGPSECIIDNVSHIGGWCRPQCDTVEAGNTPGSTLVSALGEKRKAKTSRAVEKRQRRDKEDDGSPKSLPPPAEWKSEDIDQNGFPCIYGAFHPTKFPECPITKLYGEISHYVPHLESRLHHDLYCCSVFISNFHPLPPPRNQIIGLPAPDLKLSSNWTPPDSADPFVAVCRRCWREFQDPRSLISHPDERCDKREPGKMGKWNVLSDAFCVNLYKRRYPTVLIEQPHHQQEQAMNHPQVEPFTNRRRAPSIERQDAHDVCVPMSEHLALVAEFKDLRQQVADLRRFANSGLTPDPAPVVGNAEQRNTALQSDDSFLVTSKDSDECAIITPRLHASEVAHEQFPQTPIDPRLTSRQSVADSGIGSSLSRNNSNGLGISTPSSELSRSMGRNVDAQPQPAYVGETFGGSPFSVRLPYLHPNHSYKCGCSNCTDFFDYRAAREKVPDLDGGNEGTSF